MQDIVDLSKTLSTMPIEALISLVIAGAFGLAGFAIYAVLIIAKTKERR